MSKKQPLDLIQAPSCDFIATISERDIIDYLSSRHSAPIILPGQVIQEFWNNQLGVVDTLAAGLRKKFDDLRKELQKVEKSFDAYAASITEILDRFQDEHGHIFDESIVRQTTTFFELLKERAFVPYVQRGIFVPIADHRKRTKTPPGFKDDGDGDFFVWADFLFGLQQARERGENFSRAVLVTRDRKSDWSRGGRAHPILAGEAREVANVVFETWTIDVLGEKVSAAT